MTVKPTTFERDPQNGDNGIFTIEYDIGGAMQPDAKMDYPMQDIVDDAPATIRDKIMAYIGVLRGDNLWAQASSKVTPYLGTDLEAP